MKTIKLFIAFLFFIGTYHISAQKGDYQKRDEKIKAYKIAFLTEELNLDAKEAEQFWPIYKTFQDKLDFLRKKERESFTRKVKDAGGINKLSEKQSQLIVELDLFIDKEKYNAEKDFITKLEKVFTYRKILKLKVAERKFKRQMFEKLRKKQKRERP